MTLVPRKRSAFLLGVLLALVILTGCGSNFPAAGIQQAAFRNIPLGKGNDPEPGTDGKAQPAPEGHTESILTANNLTYVGSDNGQIYTFDALSGRLLWHRQESATSLHGSIGNTIYATDARPDSGNSVYALNAANGAVIWRHPIAQIIDIVKVVNGTIYIATGNGASPAVVYALNAQTGAQLWQYAENGPDLISVGDGRVYTSPMQQDMPGSSFSGPQFISALDASTGHVLWRLTAKNGESIERGGIAEANGVAYLAATSGSVYAVQAASGQLLWYTRQVASRPIGMKAISAATPVINNGIVYTGSTGGVFAYRTSDGKLLWQYSSSAQVGPPLSIQPLVAGNSVYFSTSVPAGSLVALRASDGKLLWQHPGASIDPSALALVNGLLINQIGDVTTWRTSDGSKVWDQNTDNGMGPPGPGSPEMIGNGIITIGEGNGTVRVFRLSDGTQLWHYKIQELPVQGPPVYSAFVTFTRSTSYDRAIQIVSDLGLKTFADCNVEWVPEDGKTYYASSHLFTVAANANSAPLWLDRLKAMPEVAQAQAEGMHGCTNDPGGPIQRLSESQAGTYLQVSFSGSIAYTKAWESLNTLGFRLANPCYEKARAQGQKPTWHPMGEESSFGKTHTLVLATTRFNATTWRQQLQSVTGINQITMLSGATCS
jgi:outer membrane protein assembly factor BamB